MGLLDTMLSAGGSGLINQMAGQFGITGDQATSALKTMVPAVASGIQEKVSTGGSSSLMNMLTNGSLSKFAENPSTALTPAGMEQGKSLLSSIFGGDMTSLVSHMAEKTGLGGSVITSMLPVVATLFGGFLSKESGGSADKLTGILSALTSEHQGILGAVKAMFAKMTG
jgi:hypothetical protein